jgi:outer membrane protein insertion porin family
LEDQQSLFDFTSKHGYRDYQMLHDTLVILSANRWGLNIRVHEGDPYYFRNITWLGNTNISQRNSEPISWL